MSYCHYWGRPAELDIDRFRLFVNECKQLRQALGVPILGIFGGVKIGSALGYGKPIFNENTVCFNGRPSHETMLIQRIFHHLNRKTDDYNLYWDFVGTDQKPYDVLVIAVLLSFKHYFPEVALYSDGDREDWAGGIFLYEKGNGMKSA